MCLSSQHSDSEASQDEWDPVPPKVNKPHNQNNDDGYHIAEKDTLALLEAEVYNDRWQATISCDEYTKSKSQRALKGWGWGEEAKKEGRGEEPAETQTEEHRGQCSWEGWTWKPKDTERSNNQSIVDSRLPISDGTPQEESAVMSVGQESVVVAWWQLRREWSKRVE